MTARRQRAPQKGTGPALALRELHKLEGQATGDAWYTACSGENGTNPDQFDGFVQSLINSGMVFQRRGKLIITDEGLVCLDAATEVVPREEPALVPARSAPTRQALSARFRPDLRAMREGALDYRGIPSLHGDERVAFRTSLTTAGGDAQA